jgi:hypothetical protein
MGQNTVKNKLYKPYPVPMKGQRIFAFVFPLRGSSSTQSTKSDFAEEKQHRTLRYTVSTAIQTIHQLKPFSI